MLLKTYCQQCGQPLTVTLDDASEAEAQDIAGRVLCVPCGVQRMGRAAPTPTRLLKASKTMPPGRGGGTPSLLYARNFFE